MIETANEDSFVANSPETRKFWSDAFLMFIANGKEASEAASCANYLLQVREENVEYNRYDHHEPLWAMVEALRHISSK